jgi:hypothetical protein
MPSSSEYRILCKWKEKKSLALTLELVVKGMDVGILRRFLQKKNLNGIISVNKS